MTDINQMAEEIALSLCNKRSKSYAGCYSGAKAALEMAKAMQQVDEVKWVSVEDRLPEDNEIVFAVDGHQCMEVSFYMDGSWWFEEHDILWVGVTHWMPLPQPPRAYTKEEVQAFMDLTKGS